MKTVDAAQLAAAIQRETRYTLVQGEHGPVVKLAGDHSAELRAQAEAGNFWAALVAVATSSADRPVPMWAIRDVGTALLRFTMIEVKGLDDAFGVEPTGGQLSAIRRERSDNTWKALVILSVLRGEENPYPDKPGSGLYVLLVQNILNEPGCKYSKHGKKALYGDTVEIMKQLGIVPLIPAPTIEKEYLKLSRDRSD